MSLVPWTTAEYHALLRAMPVPADGVELILRRNDAGITATVRRDGAPPRVFLAADRGVVELLPHEDTALPGAAALGDLEQLQKQLADSVGVIQQARLVAWRPGKRAVLRLSTPHGVRWLKLLDAKTWRRAERAFAAVGETFAPLQLARPTHLLPKLRAYVAPDAPGTSLRERLAAGESISTSLVRAVLALAYTQVVGELPVYDFAKAREAACGALRQATLLRPELAELADRIAALAVPPAARIGFVHGDLHDKQILLADDRATLIDLEGMAVGDARFDITNLAEHVRLRELQRSTRDSGFADALLARCALAPDEPATRAFRTVVRARLCGVYALRPRWAALVEHLRLETLELLETVA